MEIDDNDGESMRVGLPVCVWHLLLTDRVVLWLVCSFEATESVGGAKHDWPVCPGQPAASVASRQAHRSWETRGLRWAIAYAFL